MQQTPVIQLLKGFCTLVFGQSKEQAVALFGEPEEVQNLSDELLGNDTLVYHYWDHGFSLFFDNRRGQVFCNAEIDNRDTLLFEVKLFSLKEKELIALMNANGYPLSDSEVQAWGEKRLSFDSAGLDCYFENNRLVSVNCGVLESGSQFTYFPN